MSPLYPTFRFKSEDRCDRSDGNVLCARRPVWSPPLPSASGFDWWGETGSLFWKRACLKIGCSKIHQNPMVDFHVPHENIGNLCYLDVYLSSRHTRWCTPKILKKIQRFIQAPRDVLHMRPVTGSPLSTHLDWWKPASYNAHYMIASECSLWHSMYLRV